MSGVSGMVGGRLGLLVSSCYIVCTIFGPKSKIVFGGQHQHMLPYCFGEPCLIRTASFLHQALLPGILSGYASKCAVFFVQIHDPQQGLRKAPPKEALVNSLLEVHMQALEAVSLSNLPEHRAISVSNLSMTFLGTISLHNTSKK